MHGISQPPPQSWHIFRLESSASSDACWKFCSWVWETVNWIDRELDLARMGLRRFLWCLSRLNYGWEGRPPGKENLVEHKQARERKRNNNEGWDGKKFITLFVCGDGEPWVENGANGARLREDFSPY